MDIRIVPVVALWSLVLACGEGSDPADGNSPSDPNVTNPNGDPSDPGDPTDPGNPPDDTETHAGPYLDVTSGYFVGGFAYDAEAGGITSAFYDDTEYAPYIALVLYTDEWTFDFTDPHFCVVEFELGDASVAPWSATEPDVVYGITDNAASPGFTDCYDDSVRPSLDPAMWPDIVADMGTQLGIGAGLRSERVEDTFADEPDMDDHGLIGGVMSLPDLFVGGPMYHDVFGFAYALDENHEFIVASATELEMVPYEDVTATDGTLPTGYYDFSSLDVWLFTE
jgi:hypothetical protein